MFKVEIREQCKVCGNKITKKRFRTYCSKKCRGKAMSIKYLNYRTDWHRRKRDEEASKPSSKKIQCLVCGKYYIQVCSHVLQVHKLTARKYKEEFGLDVKRGRIPKWYRKVKAEICKENGTTLTGAEGIKCRFKVGDRRAGRYERSAETMTRLKGLHKFNKLTKNI